MKINLHGREVEIHESNYLAVPQIWVFDERLKGGDLLRLCRLLWRFEYFKKVSPGDGDLVYSPSQKVLCDLFGMSQKSQPKVSEFLTRMEEYGYITRIRSSFVGAGDNIIPRHFIVVNRKGA